jgi:hypothetical protein
LVHTGGHFYPGIRHGSTHTTGQRYVLASSGWEVIWSGGKPLLEDTFSFTRFGQHWINHSWLAQVSMFLLYRSGGLPRPRCHGYTGDIESGIGVSPNGRWAVFASVRLGPGSHSWLLRFGPRPQLASLVFFSAVTYVLYLYKWRGQERLWLLPLLFVVWSNLHGGYVLGLLAIGAV